MGDILISVYLGIFFISIEGYIFWSAFHRERGTE